MNPIVIIVLVLLGIVVIGIVWTVRTQNNFKRKEIRVNESLSGIEAALTNRYDSLTKLLETVKGYMAHEKDTYTQLVSLRKGMSIGELQDAEKQVSQLSEKVFAVAENYPELCSSQLFIQLQQEIRHREEDLQAARRTYNADVTAYNTAISIFPANLLAGNRSPMKFFEAEAYKKEDVKIQF